jgi:hypothetical protein
VDGGIVVSCNLFKMQVENDTIDVTCNLWGEQFSPKQMMGELPLDTQIIHICEPGQDGLFGRYKGVKYPHGACTIKTPETIDHSKKIEWMTDFISYWIDLFKNYRATHIVLHIEWRGQQGNMEFTSLQLRNLATLQIPLSISYTYPDKN